MAVFLTGVGAEIKGIEIEFTLLGIHKNRGPFENRDPISRSKNWICFFPRSRIQRTSWKPRVIVNIPKTAHFLQYHLTNILPKLSK